MARKSDILDQIEKAASSTAPSLADALRLCVTLGGRSGSIPLREWASRELRGYDGLQDLPSYRKVQAPILIDGVQGNSFMGGAIITGQRISPSVLPDFVQEDVGEVVALTQPIAEIEQLSRSKESVKVSLPMAADLVRYMNSQNRDSLSVIHDLYWSVAPSALYSIVDQVCTTLVELIAEIRAGLPPDAEVPSADLADEAVGVVIHGNKNRVVVNSARADHTATVSSAPSKPKKSRWWQAAGAILVGLATIAGTVFAGLQLLG